VARSENGLAIESVDAQRVAVSSTDLLDLCPTKCMLSDVTSENDVQNKTN
jgi:hypothetical protein